MRIKVIGLGSPHGDDQAGWEVIRLLQQNDLSEAIRTEALDRPGPALTNYLNDCDLAILIDGCDAGWPPGQWQQFNLNQLLECAELQGGSSHQLGVADSLQLAVTLAMELPEVIVFPVQIQHSQPMTPPSTTITRSCAEISAKINAIALKRI